MSPDHPVSSRNATHDATTCSALDCDNTLAQRATGRPARFCSNACRTRFHRHQQLRLHSPVTVEVDGGSASSRGRLAERGWLVRLRRDDRSVVVTIGLSRIGAEHLAEQISDLLAKNP